MPTSEKQALTKIYSKVPKSHKATMLELRKRILKVIPHAEEVVSYGMPAFKVSGSIVAGIKANKDYIGYYPFSGSVLKNFKRELSPYRQTKSAIHVPLEKPLPQTLIRKLITARISDCAIQQIGRAHV